MPLKIFNDGRSGFRFNWTERRLRMRSLYTADPSEAEKRAAELRNGMKAEEFKRKYANAPKSAASQSLSDRMAKYRTEAPTMDATPPTEPTANVTLDEVLSRVSEQRLGEAGPPLPQPSTPVAETATDDPEDGNAEWDGDEGDKPATKPKSRNWKSLGRKVANGLGQANMVLLALGIKVFATNKKYVMRMAEASEESVATTAEGWEMLMEELLVNHPPKPIHLIVAGNVFMAVSMVAGSERVLREVDEAQRIANAAGPPQPQGTVIP
jgi:hypothetical protein